MFGVNKYWNHLHTRDTLIVSQRPRESAGNNSYSSLCKLMAWPDYSMKTYTSSTYEGGIKKEGHGHVNNKKAFGVFNFVELWLGLSGKIYTYN